MPLHEVVNICVDQLYNSELTPPNISQGFFHELLGLATMGVQFNFNNIMYEQIDGVPFGANISKHICGLP